MTTPWKIRISEAAAKVFEGIELTGDDRVVIQKWAETVAKHGPAELQRHPSIWADHPLFGEWRGYRASSFSYSGRIIYKVENHIVTVIVMRISTTHDYRK